ncbi:MAG: aldehyde ferredoxin oxidoreductase C-terminal domain-containing protein [Chloroflexota bacterium]
MDIPGYTGRILYVDLTSGRSREEPVDPELIMTLIGGYGIHNRLAFELIPKGTDPLSPQNLIIIGAGPFAGTTVPGAAKVLVTTRFPINGAFNTAAGGGSFAARLKSAGYDHVIIGGQAQRPTFLNITEAKVEFCDAAELQGKDVFETTDILESRYQPCSVIPIGQAGENLVKISLTSVDKAGTLGRGGLPAIMGAKNLKAIVVQQGTVGITVAHQLEFQRLINDLHQRIMAWPGRQYILKNGLMAVPPDIVDMHQRTRKTLACPGCPLGDKQVVILDEGPYADLQTYSPHTTIYRFSSSNSSEAHQQSIKYLDTLNRYGLCRVDFSSLLSTVVGLYREGVITKEDTGGLEPKDDIETALKLAEMTAYRQGFGQVLAEGLAVAAHTFGRKAEKYIAQVKGHGVLYDPRRRRLGTMEFDQITNPRGAHVAAGGSPSAEPGRPPHDFVRHGERMGIPEAALKRVVGPESINPGRYSRYSEDWYSLFNCLSLCNRAQVNRFYHVKTIADIYSALTGITLTPAQLMKASERAWTIGKLLNVREGFDRSDDAVPEVWFTPLIDEGKEYRLTNYEGTTILTREDMERLLDDYYDERGYDKQNGLPTPAKLEELGLGRREC